MEPYKTLGRVAHSEIIERKSRFIGWGSPVNSEDEARAFIERVRQEHREASHVCHAMRVELDERNQPTVVRMSDAGEPSGTAGSPILAVMTTKGLVGCCVVVVRYFGGTLLGASGLIRAYGAAAAVAVGECGIVTFEPTVRIRVTVAYNLWDILRRGVATGQGIRPFEWRDTEYGADVRSNLRVLEMDEEYFRDKIRETTNGRASVVSVVRSYEAWRKG